MTEPETGIVIRDLKKLFVGNHSTITEYGDGTTLITTTSAGLTREQLHELRHGIEVYLELVPETAEDTR